MITELAQKIVSTYDNLSPKRKALADILGILLTIFISVGIMSLVVHFKLMFEFAMCALAYGVIGMISILYKARVEYYEIQNRFKND